MSLRTLVLWLACAVLCDPSLLQARVLTVRQDGSGDFMSLTSAVAAAVAHDSIEVGSGTYAEGGMITIEIPLVLYSTDGSSNTKLDGAGTHRILNLRGAMVHAKGFTFSNGEGVGICDVTCGGAALVWQGAQVVLEDCLFENNTGEKGGALYVTDSNAGYGTSVTVRESRFTGGFSASAGSAAYVVLGASASFEGCVFDNNTTGITSTVDVYNYSHADIRDCLFVANKSFDVAGAAAFYRSSGTIERNTFVDNTSLGNIAGTVLIQECPSTLFQRNIIVGETAGYGLRYFWTPGVHSCNVFWDNAAGPIGGEELAGNEVVEDPIFCLPGEGDYHVSDNSPAAPQHSACGLQIGAFPVACSLALPGAPSILDVTDVPNDNGGQVRLRWAGSQYDARGSEIPITQYGVYRRSSPGATPMAKMRDSGTGRLDLDGWDFIATAPARGDAVYQFVSPTLCDTWAHGDTCWSVFFISAMTPDPLMYFDSRPDSGYSIDNIPPQVPTGFAVTYEPGQGNALTWDPATDPDFASFRVYRDSDPAFVPGPEYLVSEIGHNQWVDPEHGWGVYYKVTAMDDGGNESLPASPGSVTDTGESAFPTRWALHRAVPNPFNPQTTIAYDVPSGGGRVQLRVYDAFGRLVRVLVNDDEAGGRHRVVWDGTGTDGRRLASGTYFYNLQTPGYARTLKVTLLQ